MSVLPAVSSAVTVMVNGEPAVAFAGAVTVKCVAGPAVLVSEKSAGPLYPVAVAVTV